MLVVDEGDLEVIRRCGGGERRFKMDQKELHPLPSSLLTLMSLQPFHWTPLTLCNTLPLKRCIRWEGNLKDTEMLPSVGIHAENSPWPLHSIAHFGSGAGVGLGHMKFMELQQEHFYSN